MRLRFWLAVLDAALWIDLNAIDCHGAVLWAIGKCSSATRWEP